MSTAVATMGATAARALTDEVKADAAALWEKLLRLYDGGAHEALDYSSWGAYYEAEFGGSGNYGYRLLKSAGVMEQLPMGNSRPASERVARELVPVLQEDPERVEEVWADVVDLHGPRPTARQVRELVRFDYSQCPHCRRKVRTDKPHECPGRTASAEADFAWRQKSKQRIERAVEKSQAAARAVSSIRVNFAVVAADEEMDAWRSKIREARLAMTHFEHSLEQTLKTNKSGAPAPRPDAPHNNGGEAPNDSKSTQ